MKAEKVTGQVVGYVRVSTLDQRTDRQLFGIELHRTFTDTASGKNTDRPELARLVAYVREGDTIVVHSMDRLARNLEDLRSLVRTLTGRGVRVQFIKEGLTFTAEESPMSQLLLNVMGSFAEFERALIRERQREGVALAKARGVYKGRKRSLTAEQVEQLRGKVAAGDKKTALAREFSVSRETVHRYLRKPATPATVPDSLPQVSQELEEIA
jgi:DNA invertase Pin-like site-specific DNA recombinase